MKFINLDVVFSQITAITFIVIVFIILLLSIILFVRGIINRRNMNAASLPDLEGMAPTVPKIDIDEESENSFFDLDALNDDEYYTDDMASYKILQDANRVQGGNSTKGKNPFKR